MTDIFFSYRSVDRERVRPIHDAFAKQGFDVFWDQEVPSGVDWDTWIRQHLSKSKCAVVFWSLASVESDNVRHEATVAKRQNKLIQVLLEPLMPDQLPMGMYSQQAVNLADWNGDFAHAEWRKLTRDIEEKLTPSWVRRKIDEFEAELVAERARREGAENRDRAWQAQIAKEVLAQDNLKRERDKAVDEAAALTETVSELSRARSEIEAQLSGLRHRMSAEALMREELKRERDRAVDAATALENAVSQSAVAQSAAEKRVADLSEQLNSAIMQPKSTLSEDATSIQVRKLGQGDVPFTGHRTALLLAIVAGFGVLGVWAFWDGRATSPESPVLSQAKPAPVAPPQVQMPPSVRPVNQPVPTSVTGLFNVRSDTEAYGEGSPALYLNSMAECEQSCQRSVSCKIYTYNKGNRICFLYRNAELRPSAFFDTGLRK